MKVIGFLAQNRQEVDNLLPIMAELDKSDSFSTIFISLNAFFKQGGNERVRQAGYALETVEPEKPLDVPFYLMDRVEKLVVLLKNRSILNKYCEGLDALVCCSDGAIERVCINSLRRRGKQTFLIMNGFILNEPIEAWVRFFRHFFQALCISEFFPSEIGQGGCSLIFAPGEDARDQLLKRGISPANILVTGVPRFAGLVEQVLRETERGDNSQNHISRGKIRFLYLLGAWDWHANELGMYAEWENIKALDAFAAENRKQFSCVVRVHPRSSQYEISRVKSLDNLNIENLENDLSASLSTTDIAGAIFSTGLLEAIALQKIAVIFDPAHFLPVSAKDTYLEYGMIVVEKMGQFDTLITRLVEAPMSSRDIFQNEVKAFFKFIHPNSIKSAEIIAERIKKELAE